MAGMIDSAFFGDLYSTAEMREVWSDRAMIPPGPSSTPCPRPPTPTSLRFSRGFNIAARLEGLADGGGVCVSGTAYDQVEASFRWATTSSASTP